MKSLFSLNCLGQFVEVIIGIVALVLSALLSFSFFASLDASIPAFSVLALSLTEGGLLAWLVVFVAKKHHPILSMVAGLMTGACIVTTFLVTMTSAYILVFHQDNLVSGLLATVTEAVLLLMFGLHVLAAIIPPIVIRLESWLGVTRPVRVVESGEPASPLLEVSQQVISKTRNRLNGHRKPPTLLAAMPVENDHEPIEG